jgi:CHAD domain-containing protein
MSYRFRSDRRLAKNANKVVYECVDRSIACLQQRDDPAASIHAARKYIKKIRSLLRLLRPALDQYYQYENDGYRTIARCLGELRDQDALVACLQALLSRQPQLEQARDRVRLQQELAQAQQSDPGEAWFHERVMEPLQAARERVSTWCQAVERWDEQKLLIAGLTRCYGRGRQALLAVREHPDDAVLAHEWRKRTKDLWYHHRLLQLAWEKPMKAIASELNSIGGLLGDHHDLSELQRQIDQQEMIEPELWGHAIAREQRRLLQQALPIGERVWWDKPKRFAKRLSGYWLLAHHEGGGPPG